MQAEDGLSLDAQRAAITAYCNTHDLRLMRIFEDVESGARSDRRGLQNALDAKADVFVVLKFDRLSRSIKHFCQLYEDYFSQSVELVAIREAIRLDSALGRALVSILLVFAQMEREAMGERTKEAISHIHRSGYFFGKVPFGKRAVPAPDNPRFRILVPDDEEQAVIAKIKATIDGGIGLTAAAALLNEQGIAPPQGKKWTKALVYNFKQRLGWLLPKPFNTRSHTDKEAKARMTELRNSGRTYKQVGNILNEEGYLPLKGKKFTEGSVCRLLGVTKTNELLTPRTFIEQHLAACSGEKPSLQVLALILRQNGYATPRGNTHWWPAQVRELLAGRFDGYYRQRGSAAATPPA
jgi:DNA invertase Pin-like site-specific DNA recombinase